MAKLMDDEDESFIDVCSKLRPRIGENEGRDPARKVVEVVD